MWFYRAAATGIPATVFVLAICALFLSLLGGYYYLRFRKVPNEKEVDS